MINGSTDFEIPEQAMARRTLAIWFACIWEAIYNDEMLTVSREETENISKDFYFQDLRVRFIFTAPTRSGGAFCRFRWSCVLERGSFDEEDKRAADGAGRGGVDFWLRCWGNEGIRSVSHGNGCSLKYELRRQSSALALQKKKQWNTSVSVFMGNNQKAYRLLGSYMNMKLIKRRPALDNQGKVCLTLL